MSFVPIQSALSTLGAFALASELQRQKTHRQTGTETRERDLAGLLSEIEASAEAFRRRYSAELRFRQLVGKG